MRQTKLFIVNAHYMVTEGIRSLLKDETGIEWMGHASNAASCLAFLQQQLPDVILMDINLRDMSGIGLCKAVKEKYPSVIVIGLISFNQSSQAEKRINNGVSGYVLKNATREELMQVIHTVLKKENPEDACRS